MNNRIWRFGMAAAAAAAIVVIGIVLLTGDDTGAQLSPSSSLAGTPQGTMQAQTDAGTLVISRSEPGQNNDLYLVRSDGTGLTQLTAGPGNEEHASWSPDGTRIVYGASLPNRSRIFVMNADGSEKVDLVEGEDPSWSPDGKQILYQTWDSDSPSVINADGSGRRLVGGGAPWPSYATWAPNGKIVLVRARQRESGSYAGGDLYAVNSDGSGLERLTRGAWMTSPSVSPDGATIAAYARNRDRLIALPYRGDGPAFTLLARASHYFPNGGMPLAHWAPDGKRLVLGSSSYGEEGGAGLLLVNADGSGLTNIPDVTQVIDPDWRPE